MVQWEEPQPPCEIIEEFWVPRSYFKNPSTGELYDTDPDLTYYRTRKMLKTNKLPVLLHNTRKSLAGRRVHAPVYNNGAVVDLYPTIYFNPPKQPGQLPWILRYRTEDNQSNEETDLRNDDPTQLPITLIPERDRSPLLHKHDTIRQNLRQRLGTSDTHPTNAYLGVHIGEVHPDEDITPTGEWTLAKRPLDPTQDSNTIIQIYNPTQHYTTTITDTRQDAWRIAGPILLTTHRENHSHPHRPSPTTIQNRGP